ncbi:MAG: deoxyribose-phosphate aldolase [Candidatus Brocadiaceae bacterium]|jgi:deoxyribose-phosphate aldolase
MDKVTEIAKMIDHSLLHPALTDAELGEGCELAMRCNCATVCVKPYAVKMAARILAGSDVRVGTVVSFPHGNSPTETKAAETRRVIEDGAQEVDMVANVGKVLSEDWDYVEADIRAVAAITREHGVVLKVIFANDLLPEDRHKIRLCEICSRAGVDFVKTSTGYNYVKGPDGTYSYEGATDHDLRLMREHSAPEVQVKAAGGVGYLEAILRVREIGVTRIGTGHTEEIIEDARERFGG